LGRGREEGIKEEEEGAAGLAGAGRHV
jgi:hypothetical protein